MKSNKGFTLIELLAVIVILAIIALIATPIVLGIINDSKESSNRVSASYIINAVEQSYNIAFALNGGRTPTVAQVREKFKMENAKWEDVTENGESKQQISTSDGGVKCDVVIESSDFSVKCVKYELESMKMDISTQ